MHALFHYEGVGRELVTALKYRHGRALVQPFGRLLAERLPVAEVDVVTWVPASRQGRRRRGYDQGRLLARSVGRHTAVPTRRLLTRGAGPAQTGRSSRDRQDGPVLSARRPGPGRVALVDDVVTTGATMRGSAAALRAAGWDPVVGLAVAVTPRQP